MPHRTVRVSTCVRLLPLLFLLTGIVSGCGGDTTGSGSPEPDTRPLTVRSSWGRPADAIRDPQALGVLPDGGVVLLASSGLLHRFAADGARRETVDLKALEAGPAQEFPLLEVGGDGRVYVVHRTPAGWHIDGLSPELTLQRRFEIGGSDSLQIAQYPQALRDFAVDPLGRLFIADRERRRVVRYGSDGRYEHAFGTRCSDPGSFESLDGIVIAPDGSLLVGDDILDRAQRFSPDGLLVATFARIELGEGSVISAEPIGVDASGTYYFRDSFYGDSFQRVAADGTPIGPLTLELPPGVSSLDLLTARFDSAGRMHFVSRDSGYVVRFDAAGRPDRTFGVPYGTDPAHLANVYELAVLPDGDLLVRDGEGGDRLRRFSPTGALRDQWPARPAGAAPEPLDLQRLTAGQNGEGYVLEARSRRVLQLRPGGVLQPWLDLASLLDAGELSYPSAFAVSAEGTAFLLHEGGILEVHPSGTILRRVWTFDAQVYARGIDLAPDGSLWLLEYRYDGVEETRRLLRIRSDGDAMLSVDLASGNVEGRAAPLSLPDVIPAGYVSHLAASWRGAWVYVADERVFVHFGVSGQIPAARSLPTTGGGSVVVSEFDVDAGGRGVLYDRAAERVYSVDMEEGR